MKKGIKVCKKKKEVTIYSSEHKVELIFLEEGLSIGNAFHVCYQDVNLLDLDFMFRHMEEAVDVFENEYPRAVESGYALFIRYDNAPECDWEFLGYTPPKIDNEE